MDGRAGAGDLKRRRADQHEDTKQNGTGNAKVGERAKVFLTRKREGSENAKRNGRGNGPEARNPVKMNSWLPDEIILISQFRSLSWFRASRGALNQREGIVSSSPDGSEDYRDLGFDVEKHREAIRVFAEYGFNGATTRAGLKARDLVAVRMRSGKFGIGVTEDVKDREETTKAQGCVAFEVIHQSMSADEARQVRADVERYFRRHFPGRCVDRSGEVPIPASDREMYVYISLYE